MNGTLERKSRHQRAVDWPAARLHPLASFRATQSIRQQVAVRSGEPARRQRISQWRLDGDVCGNEGSRMEKRKWTSGSDSRTARGAFGVRHSARRAASMLALCGNAMADELRLRQARFRAGMLSHFGLDTRQSGGTITADTGSPGKMAAHQAGKRPASHPSECRATRQATGTEGRRKKYWCSRHGFNSPTIEPGMGLQESRINPHCTRHGFNQADFEGFCVPGMGHLSRFTICRGFCEQS